MSSVRSFDFKEAIASLPMLPGVYRMLGTAGEVLYVGKAGQLKKRVASYFQKSNLSPRIQLMVSHVARIEITVTRTEVEALLLENNLIKTLKPRYNILFRDDKSYPFIALTGHEFPRLTYYRGAALKQGRMFGPYPNAHAARESVQLLQKIFRLRTCEDSVFAHRTRPCLLHQIHRCTAPCVGLITRQNYAEDIQKAALVLQGKQGEVETMLCASMERAAALQHYEEASLLRDQLQALHTIQQRQFMESGHAVDADIVAVAQMGGLICVNIAMVRGGRHLGDRSLFPQNAEEQTPAAVLEAFLAQHYADQEIPPLIIVSEAPGSDRLQVLLSEQAGHSVRIRHTVSGERRQWLDIAMNNAGLALQQQLGQRAGQQSRLANLRELLSDPDLTRIECFDISHHMGEAAIAACVVYDNMAMRPAEYRRYNIKDITPGDDYAAMRQALLRRYQSKQGEDHGKWPDLILIDGGAGQLHVASDVMNQLGMTQIRLLGVAKGEGRKAGLERLVDAREEKTLQLSPDSLALHLIQQIRDEAHRFAITAHRSKLGKMRSASRLEEISGVGAQRRRHLLAHFGGLQGVCQASMEELSEVKGISRSLAEKIYRQLH